MPYTGAGTHFDTIGQIDTTGKIGVKLAVVEKRLTCILQCDLYAWSSCWTSSNYTCTVPCLCSLPTEPSPEGLPLGPLRLCKRD